MDLVTVKELYKNREQYFDKEVTVGGWVRSNRDSKNFGFLVINDGTFFEPLQVVYAADKIENYAENVLGMVKAESYQISYIDLSEGDKIVVSGDRTLDENEDFTKKIKQLFAYIF